MTGSPTPRFSRSRRWLAEHEFARHLLVLVSGTAVGQLVTIASMPVITRLYSDTEVGVQGAVLAVCGALVTIAALRYDTAVVLPESDADSRRLVRLCTLINTAVCTLATVALAFLGPWLAEVLREPGSAPWFPVAGPLSWLMAELVICTYWLTRHRSFRLIAQNKAHQAVGERVAQIVMGLAGLGVVGLLLGSIVGRLASLVNLLRKCDPPLGSPDASTASTDLLRRYRKMPLVNGPNAVADAIRVNGINLLVAALFTTATLGQFTMAWQLLLAPISLVTASLSQVFLQRLATTPRGQMSALVRSTTLRAVAIGAVPFALLWLLARPLLPWFLGARWGLAGEIATVLVPWLFMMFVTSPISSLFLVLERQGTLLAFSLLYCAAPLAILVAAPFGRTDAAIVPTIAALSWTMAGMLAIFVVLAVVVSRRQDRSAAPEHARGGLFPIASTAPKKES